MSEAGFNSSLYKIYHSAVKLEGDAVKENKNCSELTVNELNLIECIRTLTKGSEGPTISTIASELDITRPSTTVAVNKLVGKKMVTKSDCANDGRAVRVKLTSKGEKAYSVHHSYQNSLVKDARAFFTEEEFGEISESIKRLEKFFDAKLEETDEDDI